MYFIEFSFKQGHKRRFIVFRPFPSIGRAFLDLPHELAHNRRPYLLLDSIVVKVLILVFSDQRRFEVSAKLHSGMSMNVGGTIDEGCRNEGMGATGGVCARL